MDTTNTASDVRNKLKDNENDHEDPIASEVDFIIAMNTMQKDGAQVACVKCIVKYPNVVQKAFPKCLISSKVKAKAVKI